MRVALRQRGQRHGASVEDVAGDDQRREGIEVVVLRDTPDPTGDQRLGQAGGSQERPPQGETRLRVPALLGQAEGPVAIERVERDLRVDLAEPVARVRALAKQRVDRADVAEDVSAQNQSLAVRSRPKFP